MSNSNVLSGFECPRCGSLEPFKIEVSCMATVYDDGTDDVDGCDWDEHSYCYCCACEHVGTVIDFTEE